MHLFHTVCVLSHVAAKYILFNKGVKNMCKAEKYLLIILGIASVITIIALYSLSLIDVNGIMSLCGYLLSFVIAYTGLVKDNGIFVMVGILGYIVSIVFISLLINNYTSVALFLSAPFVVFIIDKSIYRKKINLMSDKRKITPLAVRRIKFLSAAVLSFLVAVMLGLSSDQFGLLTSKLGSISFFVVSLLCVLESLRIARGQWNSFNEGIYAQKIGMDKSTLPYDNDDLNTEWINGWQQGESKNIKK